MRNLNYRRKQKQRAIERALRQLRLRQLQVIYWKKPQWVIEQAVSLGAEHHTIASCSSGTLLLFTRGHPAGDAGAQQLIRTGLATNRVIFLKLSTHNNATLLCIANYLPILHVP
jgi:hypothetical protein